MERFVRIADGLDVAPVLAELAQSPGYWLQLTADDSAYIPLLGVTRGCSRTSCPKSGA